MLDNPFQFVMEQPSLFLMISFVLALAIYGLNHAATFTWRTKKVVPAKFEDVEVTLDNLNPGLPVNKTKVESIEEGLILVGVKDAIDDFGHWLDGTKWVGELMKWLFMLVPTIALFVSIMVPMVEEVDPMYGHLLILLPFCSLFMYKPWEATLKFLLACPYCMPTFWIGMPLTFYYLFMTFAESSSYATNIYFPIFLVCVVSGMVTFIKKVTS